MAIFKFIGLMSGTSLDGLDIAFCEFSQKGKRWAYTIRRAETVPYPVQWKKILSELHTRSGVELIEAHASYGAYLGQAVRTFVRRTGLVPHIVSSHGHTVFHQPEAGFTFQAGDGAALAANCGYPVVCDFRTADVALGGQGAPLVPVGDRHLFGQYDFCLNLGGIANVSYESGKDRIAFDICPVNMVLNCLSQAAGKEYDDAGKMARSGVLHKALLNDLNKLSFYKQRPPRSLGREWVEGSFFPVLDTYKLPVRDKMRTVAEHVAVQVSASLKRRKKGTVLVTGGGAYNKFLIERMQAHTAHQLVLPEKETIEFKEALIFAFLGLLRARGEVNTFASVTGAACDSSGGAVYFPK